MNTLLKLAWQFNKQIRSFGSEQPLTCSTVWMWKYFLAWKRDLSKGHSSIKDEMMWVTYPAIEFLRKNLRKDMNVFEFGGGGSTLFFIQRIGKLVTVEHDEGWFKNLSEILNKKEKNNWVGHYISAERTNLALDPSIPDQYASNDREYRSWNFKNYASVIDRYPEESFDLVLVDGRARPSCVMHAVSRIKKGGWLILDNSERDYYLRNLDIKIKEHFDVVVDGVAPVPFSTSFSRTTIWRKH